MTAVVRARLTMLVLAAGLGACGEPRHAPVDAAPAPPLCDDGRDNDGDGKVDYPDDPGCFDAFGDDEADDCPSGARCAQCSDGEDNDGNGLIDYPQDPGCSAAADDRERLDDPDACGPGLRIEPLPVSGTATGTLTTTSTSNLATPCGGGDDAPAVAYLFDLQAPAVLVASTEDPATTVDTVLDLRSASCRDPGAHLACHDDIATDNARSRLVVALQPGTYYLVVAGRDAATTGAYRLDVQFLAGDGEACTDDDACAPGLVCRTPIGGSARVCAAPVCSDGRDDDADGKVDFPDDPGCTGPADATEDDTCPGGASCPQCANGVDDDLDGSTDFPTDPSCTSAASNSEACRQSEDLLVATDPQTAGSTVGATDDIRPPPGSFNGHACSSATTHSAPDVAIQLDVPAMTQLSLRLGRVSFDSTQVLLPASCGGAPIECFDNPNSMVLANVAAGRYYLIVDGFSTEQGTFTLDVSGSIANGASCELPLARSGALRCGVGYACKGAVGSRTCEVAACADGVDDNGDGRIDYPFDPGCTDPSDDAEDTVCPGVTCPTCADGLDNNSNGLADFPLDADCIAASGSEI